MSCWHSKVGGMNILVESFFVKDSGGGGLASCHALGVVRGSRMVCGGGNEEGGASGSCAYIEIVIAMPTCKT